MRTEFLCISVSGPRVKLADRKSALNPPVVYSTDRSKAVVPVLVLLSVALSFILRGDLFKVLLYIVLFLYFSVLLALRLPRLGKREGERERERANLSAFHTFVRFALVWFCLFPLPPCVWEGLRIVIVALPGHFSYLFLWAAFTCEVAVVSYFIKVCTSHNLLFTCPAMCCILVFFFILMGH